MKSVKEAGNRIRQVKKIKSVYDVTDKVKYLLDNLEGLGQPEYEEICDALDWIKECLLKERCRADGFRDELINAGYEDETKYIDNDPFHQEIPLAEYQKQRDLERRDGENDK